MNYESILMEAKTQAHKKFNSYPENSMCGGAYIEGIDGRSPFTRWAKHNFPENAGSFQKSVYKGYTIYLNIENYRGQCADRKEVFVTTFADVLRENGINCYVKSYLS